MTHRFNVKLAVSLVMAAVISLCGATNSVAGGPSLLNYQGRLTDTSGTVVPDGNYSVTFRIYDDSTTGTLLWEEGRLVTVVEGLFSVLLGSVQPIDQSVFGSPNTWLGIQLGLEPEMLPRSRLVSVPYAFSSVNSDMASVSLTSLDKTVDASELTEGTIDTARYSAFLDLENEQKIGNSAGQVAIGDHGHIGGAEAGVSFSHIDSTFPFINGTTYTNLISTTLNAPADGYVNLQFSFYTELDFRIGLGTTSSNDDISKLVHVQGQFHTVSWSQVIPVSSGSNSFFLNLKRIGNGTPGITRSLFNVNFSATYIENNYGN